MQQWIDNVCTALSFSSPGTANSLLSHAIYQSYKKILKGSGNNYFFLSKNNIKFSTLKLEWKKYITWYPRSYAARVQFSIVLLISYQSICARRFTINSGKIRWLLSLLKHPKRSTSRLYWYNFFNHMFFNYNFLTTCVGQNAMSKFPYTCSSFRHVIFAFLMRSNTFIANYQQIWNAIFHKRILGFFRRLLYHIWWKNTFSNRLSISLHNPRKTCKNIYFTSPIVLICFLQLKKSFLKQQKQRHNIFLYWLFWIPLFWLMAFILNNSPDDVYVIPHT